MRGRVEVVDWIVVDGGPGTGQQMKVRVAVYDGGRVTDGINV